MRTVLNLSLNQNKVKFIENHSQKKIVIFEKIS